MMRFVNGTKIIDKISTCSILSKHNVLSVNQMNAQIKLLNIWKALNVENYPTKPKKIEANELRASMKATTSGKLIEEGISSLAQNTYYNDAIRVWNMAPEAIKMCGTIWSAKNEIKKLVKTLPL